MKTKYFRFWAVSVILLAGLLSIAPGVQADLLGGGETPPPPTPPPVASVITTASLSPTSETVTWTTDESASSQVEYGQTSSYGSSTTLDSSLATAHNVTISGLIADTEYHFRVKSVDGSNNTVTSG